jgi:hypothetical protein
MSIRNMLKDTKTVKVSNGSAAAQTEVDSSIIDMAGFNAVRFIVDLGTVTDASVLTAQVQDNSINSSSGMADVTGAVATFTASTSSNKVMIVDVVRPVQRYLRLKFTRTAQDAAVNTILADLYQADNVPVTLDASVLASALESGN